jgi:hypothetical protein
VKRLLTFAAVFLLLILGNLRAMGDLGLAELFGETSVEEVCRRDLRKKLEHDPDLMQKFKKEFRLCLEQRAEGWQVALLLIKQMNKLGYKHKDIILAEQTGLFLSYLCEILEKPEVLVLELYNNLIKDLRIWLLELQESGYRLD